jgi:hypothetical protein
LFFGKIKNRIIAAKRLNPEYGENVYKKLYPSEAKKPIGIAAHREATHPSFLLNQMI